MFEWFRRRSRKGKTAAVIGQRETIVEANRYDLADLAPDTVSYLGQVAYFELAVFETLSRAVSESPTLGSKERLSAVAGDALAKHHGIVAELRTLKVDPAAAMEPFADSIDRFKELTRGNDWLETLVSVYITGGFLDDFFQRIVGAVEEGQGKNQGTAMFVCRVADTDQSAETDERTFRVTAPGTYLSKANFLRHAKDYIGKKLSVKYQNLTDEGIPRFPIAIGFKEDR